MSSFFQGWYFKHQKDAETLSIIAGRAEESAFMQVITQEGSYRVPYPLSAYRKERSLWLAGNYFSPSGIHLAVSHKDLELTGTLRYTDLSPAEGDIMGPFRFLPMQCRHVVISMNHTLTGKLRLNGRELDFTGGRGYIEGDSGHSFPKSYTWVQCNHFKQNCSIMASVAHIPFAGSWFWGCICVVWLDGVQYRLATYRGAEIKWRDHEQLWLTQKDLSLKIRFLEPAAGHVLDAPFEGKMDRLIRETPATPASFEFKQGDQILFEEESKFASFEHVLY
ncbi:tocopherol cyclase family protein [Oscillospiraceae bacterium MB08-C2-2]|nr:tocopherol cyclase family protein [Oscillospiraceae bacterium MB08-C2-2]